MHSPQPSPPRKPETEPGEWGPWWDPLTLHWLGTRLTPCGSGWTEWSCHCIWPLVSPEMAVSHGPANCLPPLLPAACVKQELLLPHRLSLSPAASLRVPLSLCLSPPPLFTISVFPGFPRSPPLFLSLPFFGGCTKGWGRGQAGASRAGALSCPHCPLPQGAQRSHLHCVSGPHCFPVGGPLQVELPPSERRTEG